MLYLVLFSTLAVGFFAAFTLAVETSYNERSTRRALASAESGMEFIRYHLWSMDLNYSSSPEALFDTIEQELASRLNGTMNLKGGKIARQGNTLLIPGDPDEFIDLNGAGEGFRITIVQDGTDLVALASGRAKAGDVTSTINRAIRLRYGIFERPSSIFNFGVASRSAIALDSNAQITGSGNPAFGSVLSTSLSATPVTMSGNAAISGDVSLSNPNGSVSMSSNATIAGTKNPAILAQHIHVGVGEPDFPQVNTDIFKPYATNIISGNSPKFDKTNLKNIYIVANTNPSFDSNIKVEGVIYIEAPNRVTFNSNVEITGVIAVENNPTGNLSSNVITFNSNVTLKGVDQLPATADFPESLRALTGSIILAPNFLVHFNSNFGTAGGSVVASKMEFDSNAVGTIKGSVINLDDTAVHFDSNARIIIENQGTSYQPAGLFFGSRYMPLPGSYEEVLP